MAAKSSLVRFSVSMPRKLVEGLDSMVRQRNLPNRSQALASLVDQALVDSVAENPDKIMMGILTFLYEHSRNGLLERITRVQHRYLVEIITIQVVHLEQGHSLQVLVVQGPVAKLLQLRNEFSALKGVKNVTLQLSSTLLPPIYSPKNV